MTEQQLLGVMRRVGVERFEPQHADEFDPNVHSALFEVPAQSLGEDAKPGSVGVVTKVFWPASMLFLVFGRTVARVL